MKKIILPLIAAVLATAACSGPKTVTNNYYDDGIYHDPSQDAGSFTLGDVKDPQSTEADSGDLDYYDPDDNSSANKGTAYNANGGNVIVNNYYSSPSFRYPAYNTGFYWNSWGGWGFGIGYGWGGCYDPFFYDPWYNPYCAWGYPSWGWGYSPYRWGWGGWYPGFGYNSYWAGYYQGYYYGSVSNGGDYNGRNVTYVSNPSQAVRTNSASSLGRMAVGGRKSNDNQGRSVYTRGGNIRGNTGTATRASNMRSENLEAAGNRNMAASSRFSDKNLSARRLSDQTLASAMNTTTNAGSARGYSRDSYDYVKGRATATPGNRTPVATDRKARSMEAQENDARRISNPRSTYNSRTGTRSIPKDQYNNRSSTPSRTATPGRNNSERNNDLYVPSRQRSRSYTPSGNNRSYTPSNSNNRSYTPSRSNNRSYTPSRSSSPSRSYTPSSGGGSSRSHTPSGSGSSRSSSSPSRGSGRTR